MGRDNLFSKNPEAFQGWGEAENKIILMNYSKFGQLVYEKQINDEMFDLIIADEFHNLYKYAKIYKANIAASMGP